jgi:hypothetical protein
MSGQVGGTESRPRVRPPIAQSPAIESGARTDAAPSESQGYRGITGSKEYAAPDKGYKTYGPELAGLQNDLFNGSYYPSRDASSAQSLDQTYRKEVDRKFGPRTKAAVTGLQNDLKAAGLYSGEANGRYDAATHKAIEQLRKGGTLPDGLQADQRTRLDAFRGSAAQEMGPVAPAGSESTFAPAPTQAPPMDMTGGAGQPTKPLMGPPPPPAAAAPTQSSPPPAAAPVRPSGAGVSTPPPVTAAPVQPLGSAPQAATAAARPTSQLSKIDEERLGKIEAYVRKNYPQYLDRSRPDFASNLKQGVAMMNSRPGLFRWAFSNDPDLGKLPDNEVRRVAGLLVERLQNR